MYNARGDTGCTGDDQLSDAQPPTPNQPPVNPTAHLPGYGNHSTAYGNHFKHFLSLWALTPVDRNLGGTKISDFVGKCQ
jgi:hypothetical protein